MSRLQVLTLLYALFASFTSFSQGIAEPEWEKEAILVDFQGDNAFQLPKEASFLETKGNISLHVTGFGKVTSKFVMNGNTSPVQIQNEDTISILIKWSSNTIDPREFIMVHPLESSNNKRLLGIASTDNFYTTKSGITNSIPYSVKKYGQATYLVQLINLSEGNYAISLEQNFSLMSTFTVVPKPIPSKFGLEVGNKVQVLFQNEWKDGVIEISRGDSVKVKFWSSSNFTSSKWFLKTKVRTTTE